MAIETNSLMALDEYMKMRKDAISRLQTACSAGSGVCILAGSRTKVNIAEKDLLLEQLLGNYEFLSVPVELYLTSHFWRTLKAESNKRIRQLRIERNDL